MQKRNKIAHKFWFQILTSLKTCLFQLRTFFFFKLYCAQQNTLVPFPPPISSWKNRVPKRSTSYVHADLWANRPDFCRNPTASWRVWAGLMAVVTVRPNLFTALRDLGQWPQKSCSWLLGRAQWVSHQLTFDSLELVCWNDVKELNKKNKNGHITISKYNRAGGQPR